MDLHNLSYWETLARLCGTCNNRMICSVKSQDPNFFDSDFSIWFLFLLKQVETTNNSINYSINNYFRSLSCCSLFFFGARSLCSTTLSEKKKITTKKILSKTKNLPRNIQHKKSQIKNSEKWLAFVICLEPIETHFCEPPWHPYQLSDNPN